MARHTDLRHYGDADKVLHDMERFHHDAADAMHHHGYPGFSNFHEDYGHEMRRIRNEMRRHLRDRYRMRMHETGHDMSHEHSHPWQPYNPSNLKEHIVNFDQKVEESLPKMKEAYMKHLEIHGEECKLLKKIYQLLLHFYEMTEHWNKRIRAHGESIEAMGKLDDEVHDDHEEDMEDDMREENRRGVPGSGRRRRRGRRNQPRRSDGTYAPRSEDYRQIGFDLDSYDRRRYRHYNDSDY